MYSIQVLPLKNKAAITLTKMKKVLKVVRYGHYHWLTDPDPGPAFLSLPFKMPTKISFFAYSVF